MQPRFIKQNLIVRIHRMNLRKFILLGLMLTAGLATAKAQDDDPVRVDSTIVRLNVGVVDQRGRQITTLEQVKFLGFRRRR